MTRVVRMHRRTFLTDMPATLDAGLEPASHDDMLLYLAVGQEEGQQQQRKEEQKEKEEEEQKEEVEEKEKEKEKKGEVAVITLRPQKNHTKKKRKHNDNDDQEYVVERILRSRKNGKSGEKEVKVKWLNFDRRYNCWIPERNLQV